MAGVAHVSLYAWLADGVLVLHGAFVLFVVCGGLLALRWPRVAWLHVPAALWAVVVEYAGWICPLTPLENWLRAQAGEPTYSGDFLARLILPLLYPAGLTRRMQIVLGSVALAMNAIVYTLFWRQRARR